MTVVKRFLLSFFLSTGSVSAEDTSLTARQALINMNNAMQNLNYQGTVAFYRNDRLETMKYFHAVENGQRQERLLSLNSPMREVIRDAGRVSCRFTGSPSSTVDHRPYEHSFIVDLPANFDTVANSYRFELTGEENIAMLPSYVVSIKANDQYRYDRKVWIEKRKFLPLKAAVIDLSGETLEQVVFIEQQVKDRISFVNFKLSEGGGTDRQSSLSPDQAGFAVTQLPPGFKPVYFARGPLHDPNHLVDHMVLSDGFALVSVYLENSNPGMQAGLHSAGSVNSYSHTLDGYQITVMGEVPAATVEMIAGGVKLMESGAIRN